jgi:hypothetical protein
MSIYDDNPDTGLPRKLEPPGGDPPEPETDTAASRLMDAVITVAACAPARRGTYVSHAKIYWPYIEELRAALDAMGVDWRSQQR